MARKKKSGASGLIGVLVICLVVVAAVPKEAWIGAGALLAIGAGIYAFMRFKKRSEAQEQAVQVERARSPGRATPGRDSSQFRSSEATTARVPLPPADEPVSMRTASPQRSQAYQVPSSPAAYGQGRWVPAGESVDVSGMSIPGGMVYVGTSLPTPLGDDDPCLINTSKPVARSGDYTERQMGYWPSYSEISSSARRAYLNWLADGRKDPEADVGFVFLFFYGLERRAIIDGSQGQAAAADLPLIAAELRRLLGIYGEKSNSFRRYASELLDWVSLVEHPARLYDKPVPAFPRTLELPLYVRLALGQAAVDAAPVPAHLALAWARLDPNVFLRTPAKRCSQQFEQLFAEKYAEFHGTGLVLPRNRTKLKLVYRPASAGFRGYSELKLTFKDTPDITVLTAPAKKLQAVVDAATAPLEAFSRLVGKSPDASNSLEGLLQLPAPLWPESAQKKLESLKARMGAGMVAMAYQELLSTLAAKGAFTRDKTILLARALESSGIGVEPDVLAGAKPPKAEDKVVLFALPASEPVLRSSGTYLSAVLTLQLASAVASADGEFGIKEMGHLRQTVLAWTHLTPSQSRRLLAHLRLLMEAPASLTALKKKFEPLDIGVKETIAAFMATVAQSDGEVSPAEVKMLEKVYKALGVDAKKVFTDVHAVAAGAKPTASAVAKVEETGFKLDPARIAALQKDTENVSALLANIFADAEEPTAASAAEKAAETAAAEALAETDAEVGEPATGLLGLDDAHASLARMMLSRPEWSREELLDVAADLDLMLDGALERINEAAFDAHGVPFFEGEDPVTVSTEILEKVQA